MSNYVTLACVEYFDEELEGDDISLFSAPGFVDIEKGDLVQCGKYLGKVIAVNSMVKDSKEYMFAVNALRKPVIDLDYYWKRVEIENV